MVCDLYLICQNLSFRGQEPCLAPWIIKLVTCINLELGTGYLELGTGTATVSRYDPAGAVSTRQPVAFVRVRFPSDSAGHGKAKRRRVGTLAHKGLFFWNGLLTPDFSGIKDKKIYIY